MRAALLVFAFAASSLVACGGDDGSGVAGLDTHRPAGGATGTGDPNGGVATNGTSPAAAPCAGIADAKSVSADGDASDVQLTDGAVFYRTGAKVMRAPKDGTATAKLYESPNLVRSLVIGGGLVATIESGADVDTTTVQLVSADQDAPAQTTTTNWNAGGSYFFGADAQALYAVADVPNGGEVVYQMPLTAIAAMTQLAQADDVISSAQVTDAGVWYVRDRNRVFNVTLDPADPVVVNGKPIAIAPTAQTAKEVFGVTSSCGLAVGTSNAFCSEGAMLEQRELSGASPTTLLEATKSKVPAPFGKALWSDGTLYVASSAADAKTGYTIRAIKPNGAGSVDERIVACGRTAIGEIAVDKENVVWTESGKGVFLAPR